MRKCFLFMINVIVINKKARRGKIIMDSMLELRNFISDLQDQCFSIKLSVHQFTQSEC
jgi:hypothetical protein